jgi:hypothetical protein
LSFSEDCSLVVQAYIEYNAGMNSRRKQKTMQLTVRGVPAQVKKVLASRAQAEKKSLNSVLVEALSLAAGLATQGSYDDLDHLAGLWQEDPEFDRAIQDQHQIDESKWR